MEKKVDYILFNLMVLSKELEDIQGEWNGDESGLQEDRSMTAKEASELLIEASETIIRAKELIENL